MQLLIEWLRLSAWPMEKPRAYGAFHLGFFFGGLAVCALLCYLLRRTNEKQNKAVLLTVGLFLFVSELYKQLFYTYVIGNGSYQWWIFPFQLCSVPMYLCLIAAFLPDGRLRRAFYNFMLAFNLMGGFIAFLEPSGLVHEYWTLTLHAFFWHMSLVFVGLYLGVSGRAGLRFRDYGTAALTFVGLCVVAFIINLALARVSNGSVNMFYVGPAISPIIVFKDIAARWGWYVNTPLYMLCLCTAAFAFYAPFVLIHRRRQRRAALTA